ncbi:hypothetical protein ACHAPU_007506 [Fusarium lateritium]
MSYSTPHRLKRKKEKGQQSPFDPKPQCTTMASGGGPLPKKRKATQNASSMAASANTDDDGMVIDPAPASMNPPDTDTGSTALELNMVLSPMVDSVLDHVALNAEVRVNLYKEWIKFDSGNLTSDSQGRFLCPVDATGLVPYFDNGLTRAIGLHQEYLVEVLKSVVFVFTTSDSMRLFSEFILSHFDLEPARTPQVHAKVQIFHEDSYPQGAALSRWRRVQMAHGREELAGPHFRA